MGEVMGKVQRPSAVRIIATDSSAGLATFGIVGSAVVLGFSIVYPPTQVASWILYSIAAIGLLASTGALVWRIRVISRIVQDGVEVRAKVLQSQERSWEGTPGVEAEITYDVDGRSYTVEKGFILESFQAGDQVAIVVDPKKPRRFVLRSDFYWRPDSPGQSAERLATLKLPADEHSLWPRGVMLQVEGIVETMRQKDATALVLTNGRLVIGHRSEFPKNDGSGYSFSIEPLLNEQSWPPIDITKVHLAASIVRDPLAIWARGKEGDETLVIRASVIGVPSTITDIVEAGVSRGIIPSDGKQLTHERMAMLGLQVLVEEMARQFKRTSPQAEITIKGEQMPQEVYKRLVR